MIDLKAANHTNRELELMLAGKKPLAIFYDDISVLPSEEIIPEERFRPYVEAGQFVRGERIFSGNFHPGLSRAIQLKYVLFARASEAWRIPAFFLVHGVSTQAPRHTEEVERIESALLGYTDEEIDAWCAHLFPKNAA